MTNEEAIEILENIPFTERALERICAVNMAIEALKRDTVITEPTNMTIGDINDEFSSYVFITIKNMRSEILLNGMFLKDVHPEWYRFRVWYVKPQIIDTAFEDDVLALEVFINVHEETE